jgi:alpha-tubulin suppressor-like RCC1 family protein
MIGCSIFYQPLLHSPTAKEAITHKKEVPTVKSKSCDQLSITQSTNIFPNELWDKIAGNLEYDAWRNLKSTCTFFNKKGTVPINESRKIISPAVKIITGYDHIFALFRDGQLYGRGKNNVGQLGLDNKKNQSVFTPIPVENIKSIPPNSSIRQIAAAQDFTFILFSNNMLFACGENFHGQLGLGDKENRSVFTRVFIEGIDENVEILQVIPGPAHTFVLLSNNKLYACGENTDNQLGISNTTDQYTFTQVYIEGLSDTLRIQQVATGFHHSFILLTNGELYGCGSNRFMQLGFGDAKKRPAFTRIPVENIENINESSSVQQVIAAGSHSFIQLNNGEWYACGRNYYGQLGFGNTKDQPVFTKIYIEGVCIQRIIAGSSSTFILSKTGELYACGENYFGQLGLGHVNQQLVFMRAQVKDVPNPNAILQVGIGSKQTFIVLNNNALHVCGYNYADPNKPINPFVNVESISEFTCLNNNLLFVNKSKEKSCGAAFGK